MLISGVLSILSTLYRAVLLRLACSFLELTANSRFFFFLHYDFWHYLRECVCVWEFDTCICAWAATCAYTCECLTLILSLVSKHIPSALISLPPVTLPKRPQSYLFNSHNVGCISHQFHGHKYT